MDAALAELMTPDGLGDLSGSGLDGHAARACLAAETLAWAATHRIPLPDGLRTLPFYRELGSIVPRAHRRVSSIRDLLLPFRPWGWLKNTGWSWNLHMVIEDLDKGEPLSAALERHVGRHFPGFYLAGIARAERDGTLGSALPVLAQQLRYPGTVAGERKGVLIYVAVKLAVVAAALGFIGITVMPKMAALTSELAASGGPGPLLGSIGGAAAWIVRAGVCLGLILFLLTRIEGIGERILLRLPLVGREYRRFLLADLARGMAVFLQRPGEDILSAAGWCLESSRSPWLRRRLDGFVGQVREGTPWVEAWEAMRLGASAERWIVRNAAARQDPASGFELLAQWLHEQISLTSRRLARWVDPCFTILLALIVGSAAYTVFAALTGLVYALL